MLQVPPGGTSDGLRSYACPSLNPSSCAPHAPRPAARRCRRTPASMPTSALAASSCCTRCPGTAACSALTVTPPARRCSRASRACYRSSAAAGRGLATDRVDVRLPSGSYAAGRAPGGMFRASARGHGRARQGNARSCCRPRLPDGDRDAPALGAQSHVRSTSSRAMAHQLRRDRWLSRRDDAHQVSSCVWVRATS